MWAAGTVAAMSSITFPAVSALVSRNAESDQQGEVTVPFLFSSFSYTPGHGAGDSHVVPSQQLQLSLFPPASGLSEY